MWRPGSTHTHSMASTTPTSCEVKWSCHYTVKSLFTQVHSSPLSVAAGLHWCRRNHSGYINNGWTFSWQTSYIEQNWDFRIELLVTPIFGGCIEEEKQINKLIRQKKVRNISQRSWRKSILWKGEVSSPRRKRWSAWSNAAERVRQLRSGGCPSNLATGGYWWPWQE